jgi:membrane protein
MLAHARKPGEGIVAGTLSIAALIFGAIGVFNELEADLNRIWKVPVTRHTGVWGFVRARLLSFGLIVAIGFLLLVSLVVSAGLAAWGSYWSGLFAGVEVIFDAANFAISLAVITVLFAIIYKLLPQTHVDWRDVWVGAGVTALLFTIGKLLIGLYLGKSSVSSAYGAAGSLVVLLLWVYYSAQIFLLGAEFTKAYADNRGSRQTAVESASPSSPGTS